jgi:hypothetical protein
MKNIPSILIILVSVFSLFSCNEKDGPPVSAFCNEFVIISNSVYTNRPDDDGTGRNGFSVLNAEITNDCLEIIIQSGGCGGNTIKMDVVDADRILEIAVLQRDIKVFIDNTELCNAIVSRTVSFDLTPPSELKATKYR